MRARIVIDTSILIHANYYELKKKRDLVDYRELYDRILSSIDTLTFALSKKGFIIGHTILCLDSSSFRYKFYKDYKAGRTHNEALGSMLAVLYKRFYRDFDCIQHEGMEADDLAYLISQKYDNSILVSEDGDWLQMVGNGTILYQPRKKKLIVDVDPYFEALDKLLLGCTSDNIPKAYTGKLGRITLKKHYDLVKNNENIMLSLIKSLKEKNIIVDTKQLGVNKVIAIYSIETYKNFIKNFDELWQNL